jgi:cytochrome c oxidase assembly factor CtaG
MPSVAQAVLASWSFPTWVTATNLLTVVLYLRGWFVLHGLLPTRLTAVRLAAFIAGISILQIALASPIDAFDPFLLSDHMLQHMLLMMIVPPLLLLGDPVMALLHGMPRWAIRSAFGPTLRFRPVVLLGRLLTYPPIALLLISLAMIGWHLPALYELALRSPGWHEVEHASFLFSALIFWWPLVQPWPSRPRWNPWMLPVYLLLADLVNSAVSALLVFSDRVYYPSYLLVPRLGGISAQNDQVAAGAIMWIVGSFGFLIPAAAITVRLLSPARPRVERPPSVSSREPKMASRFQLSLAAILPLAAIGYGLLAPDKIDIDGDAIRMQENAGPFHIAIFTAPDPIPSGEFKVAVLVQNPITGSVILDSDVEIAAEPIEGPKTDSRSGRAGREAAQNKLLAAGTLELPQSGRWMLHVSVHRGDEQGSLACPLEIAPRLSRGNPGAVVVP